MRYEIGGHDLGCIRAVPGHVQVGSIHRRAPDIDVVAKHDGIDVHPEHEVVIVFESGADHLDLQPTARAFPIVAVDEVLLVSLCCREGFHAGNRELRKWLLNGITGSQKAHAGLHKTSPNAFALALPSHVLLVQPMNRRSQSERQIQAAAVAATDSSCVRIQRCAGSF